MDTTIRRHYLGECDTVFKAMKTITKDPDYDQSFFVCNLADVINKIRIWKAKFPRVRPYFAVKANPDPLVLRLMISLGVGFDCASKREISDVLYMGAKPEDIIYAHPRKIPSHLRYSTSRGVDVMTFDCESELPKIKEINPDAKLVIRFSVPDVPAGFMLNDKFGCSLEECRALLEAAKQLKLKVIGTAFHVGSMCRQPSAFKKAIGMARQVFDIAEDLGFNFTLLDLGGGFPGHSGSYETFDEMANYIHDGLNEYFADKRRLQVIAEPGTYFINSSFTLCTTVIGKKMTPSIEDGKKNDQKMVYFLNNSIFLSFAEGWMIGSGGVYMSYSPSQSELNHRPMYLSKIWGCSCCSSDCILEECVLPRLEVGEHIYFENMGAYVIPLSTNFNGFEKPAIHYIYAKEKSTDYMKALPAVEMDVDWRTILKSSNPEPEVSMPATKDFLVEKEQLKLHLEPKSRT